jgi:membrane protein implicated in regulation of membrane protease activity
LNLARIRAKQRINLLLTFYFDSKWGEPAMSTLTKYLLLQAPSWLLMALLAIGLRHWIALPLWVAIGLVALWVVKDLVLYPFVRTAYEPNVATGSKRLVGARGVAQEHLAPHGYVQVHGERWRAMAEPRDVPIAPGTPVRVRAADGLTLTVTADTDEASDVTPNRSLPHLTSRREGKAGISHYPVG